MKYYVFSIFTTTKMVWLFVELYIDYLGVINNNQIAPASSIIGCNSFPNAKILFIRKCLIYHIILNVSLYFLITLLLFLKSFIYTL